MCLVDKTSLNISGVSESERLEILRMHNNFRGTVLPEASDIFTMVSYTSVYRDICLFIAVQDSMSM